MVPLYFPYPAQPSTPESFAAVGQRLNVWVLWVFKAYLPFGPSPLYSLELGLPCHLGETKEEESRVRNWLKVTTVAISISCILWAWSCRFGVILQHWEGAKEHQCYCNCWTDFVFSRVSLLLLSSIGSLIECPGSRCIVGRRVIGTLVVSWNLISGDVQTLLVTLFVRPALNISETCFCNFGLRNSVANVQEPQVDEDHEIKRLVKAESVHFVRHGVQWTNQMQSKRSVRREVCFILICREPRPPRQLADVSFFKSDEVFCFQIPTRTNNCYDLSVIVTSDLDPDFMHEDRSFNHTRNFGFSAPNLWTSLVGDFFSDSVTLPKGVPTYV